MVALLEDVGTERSGNGLLLKALKLKGGVWAVLGVLSFIVWMRGIVMLVVILLGIPLGLLGFTISRYGTRADRVAEAPKAEKGGEAAVEKKRAVKKTD